MSKFLISDYTDEYCMEINESKSVLLNAGSSSLLEVRGISADDHMRYLGIDFSEGVNYWKHQQRKISNKGKGMIYNLKCIADNTMNKARNVNLMWNGELLPATLFGTEIITINKSLYNELEVYQNKAMRYALGAQAKTNPAVMRMELGWWSMKGRIYKRKLSFFGMLVNLPFSRWARAALEENMYIQCAWFKEVMNICVELDIKQFPWVMTPKEWKTYIKRCIARWELKLNVAEINSRSSLSIYPVGEKLDSYMKGYLVHRGAVEVCKFRTNQIMLEAKAERESSCLLCGYEGGTNTQHYLLDCEVRVKDNLRSLVELKRKVKAEQRIADRDKICAEMLRYPDIIAKDCVHIYRKIKLARLECKKKGIG